MAARARAFIGIAANVAALAVLPAGRAAAGPPFQTDDPEPVPYQHFEFYTLSTGTVVRGDTQGVAPAFEFNYGLVPNGQIYIIAPLAFDSPTGGRVQFGYGDTDCGYKRASAIGRPMAAAVTGSITATIRLIAITGSSAGCCSGR